VKCVSKFKKKNEPNGRCRGQQLKRFGRWTVAKRIIDQTKHAHTALSSPPPRGTKLHQVLKLISFPPTAKWWLWRTGTNTYSQFRIFTFSQHAKLHKNSTHWRERMENIQILFPPFGIVKICWL
jgi:hypothetical protein